MNSHVIENDIVYFIDDRVKYAIGNVNKIEVMRIDNDNVQDVSSVFDLEKGEYVETGRINRIDKLVMLPNESDRITALEDAITMLMGI